MAELEDTYGMFNAEYDLNDNWTAYVGGDASARRRIVSIRRICGQQRYGQVGFFALRPMMKTDKSAMAGF